MHPYRGGNQRKLALRARICTCGANLLPKPLRDLEKMNFKKKITPAHAFYRDTLLLLQHSKTFWTLTKNELFFTPAHAFYRDTLLLLQHSKTFWTLTKNVFLGAEARSARRWINWAEARSARRCINWAEARSARRWINWAEGRSVRHCINWAKARSARRWINWSEARSARRWINWAEARSVRRWINKTFANPATFFSADEKKHINIYKKPFRTFLHPHVY